uniref:Substance-P receptor n=1 Tax=Anolis carolinensis TaxID=28377 RepID=H9GAC8_ANOCA
MWPVATPSSWPNASWRGNGSSSSGEEWASGNPFVQPGWQVALWALAYGVVVLVAVVGNGLVIWVVLAHRRMRTVTNYLLVNLAASEAAMAALNTLVNFTYAVHNDWYYGRFYCHFQNFFPVASVFSSIYSMTAIAVDRYMAIIHPLKPRLSAAATKVLICVIWALALLLSFPQGYYATTEQLPGRVVCLVDWPENTTRTYEITYHFCVTGLSYVLPLAVIGCAYAEVGITLWASGIPGDSSDRYQEQVSAKRKSCKKMIPSTARRWVPVLQQDGSTIATLVPGLYPRKIPCSRSGLSAHEVCLCSSMRLPRFRMGFKRAFRWCPFISASQYEGLEMKSARFLQTQSSMYKISRMEVTVSSVAGIPEEGPEGPEEEDGAGGGTRKRLSADLASNGSSRSDTKTVSESLSFHSNTLS